MFKKVTIIGTGLLGGSLARELRHHSLAERIVGVCRSEKTATAAVDQGVVDVILPVQDAVQDAELIVLATPMQAMLPLLEILQDCIPENAILTDVGSVKSDLYKSIKTSTPDLLKQFVLAHPIAGGEHSGVSASRLGLFLNKHVIITKTPEVDAERVQKVTELWTLIGSKVLSMSLKEHDAIFAKTSHLPHVIAFSLVNYLQSQDDNGKLFDLAAAGFYDFTRIASSDAEMWRDICITNQDQLLAALDGFRDQIDVIRLMVEQGQQEGILDYFHAAKNARDLGLKNK